jgi:hypothetical protein
MKQEERARVQIFFQRTWVNTTEMENVILSKFENAVETKPLLVQTDVSHVF